MCLIAYSPQGTMIDRSILAYAHNQNPDGIGIMSKAGIQKFLGHKALKRARRYMEAYIAPEKIPYAIHFRWATHGEVGVANTHPYVSPEKTHAVMHNGVISLTTAESSKAESDTAVFVRKYMDSIQPYDDAAYWRGIETKITWGSKLCIMNFEGAFKLCNENAGEWINGIWFSNTYSLPAHAVPRREYVYQDTWYRGTRSSPTTGYVNTYSKDIWDYETNSFQPNPNYVPYIPKEIWDKTEGKMVPNPEYKAADDASVVCMGNKDFPNKDHKPVNLIEWRARKAAAEHGVWSGEDRRSYYESLEAGLTPQEAEYYDIGTVAARAAEAELERAIEEDIPTMKDVAPIGGDFPEEQTAEERQDWKTYLSEVAAGIHNS